MPAPKTTRADEAARAIHEFRARLESGEYQPLLRRASGTLRFDLVDGDTTEHFSVELHKGDATISHKRGKADATIVVDKQLFADMVRGTVNAMAATLRGTIRVDGDLGLIVLFQRAFPSPPAGIAKPARPAHQGANR
jgi:hypothetical protein